MQPRLRVGWRNEAPIAHSRRGLICLHRQTERGVDPAATPLCCGSNALRSDTLSAPTGNFSRDRESGGAATRVVGLVEGEDRIAPSKVTDLVAGVAEDEESIEISFTAPGDDATFGKGKEILCETRYKASSHHIFLQPPRITSAMPANKTCRRRRSPMRQK